MAADETDELKNKLLQQEKENLALRERLAEQEENRLCGIERSLKILRVAIMGNENQDGIISRLRKLEEAQKQVMNKHVLEHEKILLGDHANLIKRPGLAADVKDLKENVEARKKLTRWAQVSIGGGIVMLLFEIIKHFWLGIK